jgi:hypothetical protein
MKTTRENKNQVQGELPLKNLHAYSSNANAKNIR